MSAVRELIETQRSRDKKPKDKEIEGFLGILNLELLGQQIE